MDKNIYPEFRKIKLEDKAIIESINSQYPPYCDFNFANLYNWSNPNNPTEYTILNDNLVIKQIDHRGKVIHSFLGTNKRDETINQLLRDNPILDRVPEISLNPLDKLVRKFKIIEDTANHEYILSTELISKLQGNIFSVKRRKARKFIEKYPNIEIKILDISDLAIRKSILDVTDIWRELKGIKEEELAREKGALNTMMEYSNSYNMLNVGICNKGKLIGFTINQIVRPETAIGGFGKANFSYDGIFSYLEHITHKLLLEKGIKFLNYEQDLSIPGLRQSKQSWRPIEMLKKYIVSMN